MPARGGRTLSDADVKAIVELLKSELVEDFYGEVGRGVWAWVKRAVVAVLLAAAIYGAALDRSGAVDLGIKQAK